MSIKILLLEDDTLLAETLQDLLEEEGYEVLHSPNGQVALESTFDEKFNLYLLDINVPLIDGVSLLSELRGANDTTPAIFLTSHKDKEMIKQGFSSGGDDYLIKPFDNDELLWRLEALLKRSKKYEIKSVVPLTHDSVHQSIYYENSLLELSKKEYDLLALLMNNPNANVTKEVISEALWSASQSGSDGAVRVYINRLKQVLPHMKIENVRGIGYKLVF